MISDLKSGKKGRLYLGFLAAAAVRATAEKVRKKRNHSRIVTPSSLRINVLPLKSSGNSLNSFRVADFNLESSGGWILSNIMPGQDFGGYFAASKKSLSCVSRTLPSLVAVEKSSESFARLGARLTSNPCSTRNLANLALTFSSAKSLALCEEGNPLTGDPFSSEMQGGFDVFSGKGRVVFQNFFSSFPCFQHFQNLPDHYSGSFEGKLSMADFGIRDYVLADLNGFHKMNYGIGIFKPFAQEVFCRLSA